MSTKETVAADVVKVDEPAPTPIPDPNAELLRLAIEVKKAAAAKEAARLATLACERDLVEKRVLEAKAVETLQSAKTTLAKELEK